MWKWEREAGMSVLEWSDVGSLLYAINAIGTDEEHRNRYDFIRAELESEWDTFKYVYPYPSVQELNHCLKVCRLRSLFHPKAKLRARSRHVFEMISFFKQRHPDVCMADG